MLLAPQTTPLPKPFSAGLDFFVRVFKFFFYPLLLFPFLIITGKYEGNRDKKRENNKKILEVSIDVSKSRDALSW